MAASPLPDAGGRVRIVGGRLRGRALEGPEDQSIRPTADRAREALFGLLTQGRVVQDHPLFPGARVIDAFAGTGALGIEALSRGAESAVFLENAPAALAILRRNLRSVDLVRQSEVLPADATRPPAPRAPADLLLMDPPYRGGLAAPALAALAAAGWLATDALIVVEQERGEAFLAPAGFREVERRRYGRAEFVFLRGS